MGMKERALKAINAMKAMGIDDKRVKPVLKHLLRLYDKNWQLIEDDNYTVLIDAIFDTENEESAGPPLKKIRMGDAASASGELTLTSSNIDGDDLPIPQSIQHVRLLSQVKDEDDHHQLALPLCMPDEEEQSQLCLRNRSEHHPTSPHSHSRDQGNGPMLPSSVCHEDELQMRQNVATHDSTSPQTQLKRKQMEHSLQQLTHQEKGGLQPKPSLAMCIKEPKIEPGIIISRKENLPVPPQNDGLIIPKSEPPEDYEVPIVMPPINSQQTSDVDVLTLTRSNVDGNDLPIAQSIEHDPILSQVKDKDEAVQEALALSLALSGPDKEEQSQLCLRDRSKHHPISPQSHSRDKGKDPMLPSAVCSGEEISRSQTHTRQNVASHDPTSPQPQPKRKEMERTTPQMTHKEKGGLHVRPSFVMCFKEPKIEPGIIISQKEKSPISRQNDGLIIPKSEPPEDYILLEVPVVMPPIISKRIDADGHSTLNGSTAQVNGVESLTSKDDHNVKSDGACESATSSDHPTAPEMPMSFEIASSPLGDVKIFLTCSQSFGGPGVHVPSVDELLKAVEDKCLGSYASLDPNFSIKKLLQEMCQTFLDFCQS